MHPEAHDEAADKVRLWRLCRGSWAWHAWRETTENLGDPEAPVAEEASAKEELGTRPQEIERGGTETLSLKRERKRSNGR